MIPRRAAFVALLLAAAWSQSGCADRDSSSTCPTCDPNDVFRPTITPRPLRYVAMTGSDTGTCATATPGCRTIQYAHNQAGNRDEIMVDRGSYTGNIILSKDLKITGAGSGATTLVGTMTISAGADVMLNAFAMAPNGAQDTAIDAPNQVTLEMTDVTIRGYSIFGLFANAPRSLIMTNCQVLSTTGGDGVRINQLANGSVMISRTVVKDNGGDGIQMNGAGSGHSSLIENSLIEHNGEAGIQLEGMTGGSLRVRSTCIRTNQTEAGIFLESQGTDLVSVRDSNITSNACGAMARTTATFVGRLDMLHNWWGIPGGPGPDTNCGAVNTVIGPIDYVPFAGSANLTPFDCPR